MKTSKEYDRGQLQVCYDMIKSFESKKERLERALNYGRCDECNEPLMYDELETCEDCICPE